MDRNSAYQNSSQNVNGSMRLIAWGPQPISEQLIVVNSPNPRMRYVIPARFGQVPSVATGRISSTLPTNSSTRFPLYRHSSENSSSSHPPSQPFQQYNNSFVSQAPVGLVPTVHPSLRFSSLPSSNHHSPPTLFIPPVSNSSSVPSNSTPFYIVEPSGSTVFLYPSTSYSALFTPCYSSSGFRPPTSFMPQPQQTGGYSGIDYDPWCPICNPEQSQEEPVQEASN